MASSGAVAADTYFPYPAIPESLPLGRPRANYYVEHFWDFCPWKSAFSSQRKMSEAFDDFAEMLTVAQVDTVNMALDNLISKVKKRPNDLHKLTLMAEGKFYADTAERIIDMVYLPFAKAAAANKKIPADERRRFARQASVIENSQPGQTLPAINLLLADGSTVALNDTTDGANEYVLIFDVPGSWEARMNRIQLAANASARTLIESNLIKPLYIYPGTPPAEWWKENEDLPESWTLAALPETESYIDQRVKPTVIITDSGKRITEKFMTVPRLIQACEYIMEQIRTRP